MRKWNFIGPFLSGFLATGQGQLPVEGQDRQGMGDFIEGKHLQHLLRANQVFVQNKLMQT